MVLAVVSRRHPLERGRDGGDGGAGSERLFLTGRGGSVLVAARALLNQSPSFNAAWLKRERKNDEKKKIKPIQRCVHACCLHPAVNTTMSLRAGAE